jgi:hypothetical protein
LLARQIGESGEVLGRLSHLVSNRPIWLDEAADPVIARPPTTQHIGAGGRPLPGTVMRLYFRGDAAVANPEMYEFLEAERVAYAIRLPTNSVFLGKIGYMLKRPTGRPLQEGPPVLRQLGRFLEQASAGVAKIEWHPGRAIINPLIAPRERRVTLLMVCEALLSMCIGVMEILGKH